MANAKHELISFSFSLDPAPFGRATLGVVLVLLKDTDLGGSGLRTTTYASKSAVTDAVDASEISSPQGDLLKAAFDQIPAPSKVRAGDVDATASAEDYEDGYNAVKAETSDFFYVTAETRTVSEQLVLASALSADLCFYIAQTSDASALTGLAGVNAVYTNTTQENFALVYHPVDTEALDVGYAAARGTFDPDSKSAGWQGVVRGVAAYADGSVSDAERDLAILGNVNLLLTWGPYANYVSKGVTYTGRQIKNMVSVFWYVIRAVEDLQVRKAEADAEGELIPVNDDGQAIVRNVLESRYDLGVNAGHFKAEQLVLDFPDPIPSADIDSGTIATENFRITTLQNVLDFDISVAFTRDDVVVNAEEA